MSGRIRQGHLQTDCHGNAVRCSRSRMEQVEICRAVWIALCHRKQHVLLNYCQLQKVLMIVVCFAAAFLAFYACPPILSPRRCLNERTFVSGIGTRLSVMAVVARFVGLPPCIAQLVLAKNPHPCVVGMIDSVSDACPAKNS